MVNVVRKEKVIRGFKGGEEATKLSPFSKAIINHLGEKKKQSTDNLNKTGKPGCRIQDHFRRFNTISLKLLITNLKIKLKRNMNHNSNKTMKYLEINLTKNALLDL